MATFIGTAICQQAVRQMKPNREDKEMRRQRRHRKAREEEEEEDAVTLKQTPSLCLIGDLALAEHEHNAATASELHGAI